MVGFTIRHPSVVECSVSFPAGNAFVGLSITQGALDVDDDESKNGEVHFWVYELHTVLRVYAHRVNSMPNLCHNDRVERVRAVAW